MTIEKSPAASAQPAVNTKGPSAAKASKGAASASDKSSGKDAFSDLLLGLGAEDTEGGDSAVTNLPLVDAQLAAADPTADSGVALLAQQDWFPVPISKKPDVQSAEHKVTGVKTFLPNGHLTSQPENTEVAGLKDSVMVALTPTAIGLSIADGVVPASNNLKAGAIRRIPESTTEVPHTEKSLDSPDFLKKSLRSKLPAGIPDIQAGVDRASVLRADVSQLERKAIVEMTPKLDVLHMLGAQTSVEFNLSDAGTPLELRREKMIFKSGAVEANSAINSRSDLSQPVPNVEALLSDGSVAPAFAEPNQDAYWLSSDMKNAEMKLDGIGEGPVEVSINLHGKEAHISFRSDEEQTRAALQDAESSLKDMLRAEGLELSGVSIGLAGSNFGSGAGRGQDSRPQSDLRSFKIDSALQTTDGKRSTQAGGRQSGKVDIFV